MKINGVIENVKNEWLAEEEVYDIKLDIEVESDDQVYSEKGVYLQLEYSKKEHEINRYHFVEKETDKYIKLGFKQDEEQQVLHYLKEELERLIN